MHNAIPFVVAFLLLTAMVIDCFKQKRDRDRHIQNIFISGVEFGWYCNKYGQTLEQSQEAAKAIIERANR